jgi:hypothetical protein
MTSSHAQHRIAFGFATGSGYLAALPVNRGLLGRVVKQACH